MAQLLSNTRIYGFTNIDGQLSVGNVSSYSATSNATGSLIVTGGAGISGNVYSSAIYTNGLYYAANNLPITLGGNSFGRIAVAGQSTVLAGVANDVVTLVAGSGISITTNATTDTITLNSTGSGGGVTTGQATAIAMGFALP
jgi:hypothetical protein